MIIIDAPIEWDPKYGPSCHLMSDIVGDEGTAELVAFARKIGLKTQWIQKKGTAYEHFDTFRSMTQAALDAGAKLVDRRTFVGVIKSKKAVASERIAQKPA